MRGEGGRGKREKKPVPVCGLRLGSGGPRRPVGSGTEPAASAGGGGGAGTSHAALV
jgi:hypothetical protein